MIGKCRLSCAVACLALALSACGGEKSSADGSTNGRPQPETNEKANRGRLPATTCLNGTAELGGSEAEIDFAVACRAKKKGGKVGFTISRPRIRVFSRHPTVGGPGARHRYGRCVKPHNRPVECQAEIEGKVKIAGRLIVDPETRCSAPISITVNETRGCNENVCPLAFVTRQIFAGLPRGC